MKNSARVLIAVVVLGVAYAAASWYVGKQAQATLQRLVGQANTRLASVLGPGARAPDVKLSISQYKRHVFSSDVVYTMLVNNEDGSSTTYLLSDHLQHGPFPWEAIRSGNVEPLMAFSRARLVPSPATQKWFDSLKGLDPIEGVTQIGFSGKGDSVWQFRRFSLHDNGDSLEFGGGNIDIAFSNNFRNSTTKGAFGKLEYASTQDNEGLNVQGMTLGSATTTANESGDVTTHSTVGADQFKLQSGDSAPVRLDKVTISLDTTQRNKRVDGVLRYDFGNIQAGDVNFGSVAATLKGNDLDVDALSALVAEYDRIKARHNVTSDEDFNLTDEEAADLQDKLWVALGSQPTIAIDPFVWKTDKGQSTLKLSINLTRPTGSTALGGAMMLLPQIVKQLDLDVSVGKPMFVQTFSQLQSGVQPQDAAAATGALIFDTYAGRLTRAGLATQDQDHAATHLRYGDNRVNVNGRAMSVTEFVQRVLSAMM
jgi:uncharacterized protein YdgA (DUF945 family)